MVGPRFLYGYSSSGATATATATATGYDPSNAVAIERATTWLGVGTGAQFLKLDMGAAVTVSGLGICAGNYSKWGTTTLEYSSDNSSWTSAGTLSVGSLTDYTQDFYMTVSSISRRYWKLSWASATAAPELSVFYLGLLSTLGTNYEFPFEGSDVYGVDVQQSEGRILTAEQVARRRERFPLEFMSLTSTDADAMRAIIQSEGGPLRPFFFVPIDESGSSTSGRAYLVRYEVSAFTLKRLHVNPYAFTVPLLEEV